MLVRALDLIRSSLRTLQKAQLICLNLNQSTSPSEEFIIVELPFILIGIVSLKPAELTSLLLTALELALESTSFCDLYSPPVELVVPKPTLIFKS